MEILIIKVENNINVSDSRLKVIFEKLNLYNVIFVMYNFSITSYKINYKN